jgi:putative endopeptidase
MATRQGVSPSGGHVALACERWQSTRRSIAFSAALTLCIALSWQPLPAQARQDFLAANIDTTVSPGEDFFQYANGAWLKRNPIPDDEGIWAMESVTWEDLMSRLRRASEAAAASNAPRGSVERLIGDFWFTGMDSAAINQQGLGPLRLDLQRIDAIRSIGDVIEVVATLHRRNMLLDGYIHFVGPRTLFAGRVEQDERNSSRRIFNLSQGGISLGPWVYSATDAQRVGAEVYFKRRDAVRDYMFKTFLRLHGDSSRARTSADAVFDLEARLARGFSGGEEYHMVGLGELSRLAPAIDWNRYFRLIGARGLDSVNMRTPRFYQTLDSVLRTTPLETWRDYLRFCLVRSHAPFLDDATFGEFFALNSAWTGAMHPRPRWKRVVWQEQFWLGHPLARLVAKEYFPPSTKARYQAVGESLREAFRNRIVHLDWMSDTTKQNALLKLARLRITIGLPEKWLDFSTMPLRRDSYALNMIRSAEWFHDREMKQLNTPVDRAEGDPQYNLGGDAYYISEDNEAVLPSPREVPGWSEAELDDAFVYGATSLGHEISHAFDSKGRYYDSQGNKVDWWTTKDSVSFDARAQILIDEYNELITLEGQRVDGRSSLAENIADQVGARIELDAFKHTEQYKRNQKIAGFTPLQRFFLAYAYGRACHARPTGLPGSAGGAYAPCRERVNGVLMNIPEFYEAFNVKPGDRMYRAEDARVKIW